MGEDWSFSIGEAQEDPSELCVAKRSKDSNSLNHNRFPLHKV